MSNHIRTSLTLALVTALSTCHAVLAHNVPDGSNEFIEGSGWFTRAGQKTQFAVAAECEAGKYSGHFEFKDQGLNFRLRDARITAVSASGPDTRVIEGTTHIVGAARDDVSDGTFHLEVTDGTSDAVLVTLSNGFTTGGNLLGGNLRIHRHPGNDGGCTQPPLPTDTTAPVVELTAPANGATVSGTVALAAAAHDDDSGVAGVRFLLDGTAIGSEDTTAPYAASWDTHSVGNGSHSLTAIARDVAGNSATSAPVPVTVNNVTTPPADTTPPTVELTAPANGATVSGTVALTASAADSDSGVASVRFVLDGSTVIADDTSAPYAASWDSSSVANGSHNLMAIARDVAGNSATSGTITVNVNNGGGGGETVRVEEDNAAVTYTTNSWLSIHDGSVSGGSVVEANQAGATATLSFTGTGVTWIGYRCTCAAGIAKLYVDGTMIGTADSYSPSPQAQAPIYTVQGLPSGNHTFKIEVTGTYNDQGETAYIVIDAFDVQR